MIALDIETSGLDASCNGIWQIGALDFYNPDQQFFEEARIDDEDKVEEAALLITGKNEEQLRNREKQPQRQLVQNFLEWVERREGIKNFLCQNPMFDVGFISERVKKYGLRRTFYHRSFDLHSIAQMRHHQIYGGFSIKRDHSDMDLTNILKLCGLKDERRIVKQKLVREGHPHNALEDAKLTAECFSRLIQGKNLLPEYNKSPVPYYLIK